MNIENTLKIFADIAKPFFLGENLDKDFVTKEEVIMDLLKEYNPSYIKGVGIIIPSKNITKKVFVSHIDLVSPFQKGFYKNEVYEINDTIINGALDNTLTNAFLLQIVLENGLPDDVSLLFTEGEESGLTGMRNYMSTIFPELLKSYENVFFVNLDVTNDNFLYSTSIEFDYPDILLAKEINKKLPGLIGFQHNRFTDDTSAIVRIHKNAFSCCIPTREYCHTYKSNTSLNKFEGYYTVLKTLMFDIDFSGYEHNTNILNNNML